MRPVLGRTSGEVVELFRRDVGRRRAIGNLGLSLMVNGRNRTAQQNVVIRQVYLDPHVGNSEKNPPM